MTSHHRTDGRMHAPRRDASQSGRHAVSAPEPPAGASDPTVAPSFESLMAPVPLPRRRPPLPAVIGAVVGVVLVIALVVALVVMRPFSGVHAADYAQASRATAALQSDYEATDAAVEDLVVFLYGGASHDPARADVVRDRTKAYRAHIAAFAGLRAHRDDAVAAAYETYRLQAVHYADLADGLADAAGDLNQAVAVCGAQPADTVTDDAFAADVTGYIASCRAAADAVSAAPTGVVSDFGDALTAVLDQMAQLVAEVQTTADPANGMTSSARAAAMRDLATRYVDLDMQSGTIGAFRTTLDDTRAKADPGEALRHLDAVLTAGAGDSR